jgi:molybdopterin-dependent oxidoreductase alpha subunit
MLRRKTSHSIKELLEIVWHNRRELPYAWRILRWGICDGCSLGAAGLRDENLSGWHVCMPGLRRLRIFTMGSLEASLLADVSPLRDLDPERLHSSGRIPYPMLRQRGGRGFRRIAWDRALDIIGASIRDIAPHEMGFFAGASGSTNETYYVFQKLARVLGTNNIALCSSTGDARCVSALNATLGLGAASCSLADVIDTDLLVIFGSHSPAVQPLTRTYLRSAKKRGTRIVAVSPTGERRAERDSLTAADARPGFGADLIDDSFHVCAGGESAFVNGVLKALIAWSKIDHEFIARHTNGFDRLAGALAEQPWDRLEQRSGVSRSDMQRFAARYRAVSSAVFIFCVEPLQQESGADSIEALVNLALIRGMLGRDKCGILPILSQSGTQGARDCGAGPDAFPGGIPIADESARRFSNLWYHPAPSNAGLSIPQMMDAAGRGKLKFLYSIGGDLFDTTTDQRCVAEALERVPLRIHQDIALNHSMLADGAGTVMILPAQTRYEQRGGGTTTSTERKIRFAPEIPGHAIGESLPSWEIPALIGRRSMPNGEFLFPFRDTRTIRAEMARVIPIYRGIENLNEAGDSLQWGGPHLFKGGKFRGMPGERALFSIIEPVDEGAAAEP